MKRIFIRALLTLISILVSIVFIALLVGEKGGAAILRGILDFTIFVQYAKPQVLYYSPVVNASGQEVAYIKRTVDYSIKGGSIMPFMGDSPEVTIKSDLIELCRKNILSGEEVILHSWSIPLAITKSQDIGDVTPELDWHQEKLRYRIKLSTFGNINIGRRSNGASGLEFDLTNLEPWESLMPGPQKIGRWGVRLSEDPERIRYPTNNNLLVERTE